MTALSAPALSARNPASGTRKPGSPESILHAMAEPTRLGILQQLAQGECCVCDLGGELDVEQSLLSHHLRTLRKSGLVQARREGRWAYYSLNPRTLMALRDLLDSWITSSPVSETPACCGARISVSL